MRVFVIRTLLPGCKQNITNEYFHFVEIVNHNKYELYIKSVLQTCAEFPTYFTNSTISIVVICIEVFIWYYYYLFIFIIIIVIIIIIIIIIMIIMIIIIIIILLSLGHSKHV